MHSRKSIKANASNKFVWLNIKPLKTNNKIDFSENNPMGRITLNKGIRIIDWDGKTWKVFEKEGATWYPDEANNSDLKVLKHCLSIQRS